MSDVCNESTTLVPLELGFVQPTEPWKLTSFSFPSKVGGRPAWLALKHLPQLLSCQECHNPLYFLLQVYSPIEGNAACFHRSIFVFICKNGACYSNGKTPTIRAFRSQLSYQNSYYPLEVTNLALTLEEVSSKLRERMSNLCATCGCYGDIKCSNCKSVTYCCDEHENINWEAHHESVCQSIRLGNLEWDPMFHFNHNPALLPEMELIMGPDPQGDDGDLEDSCEKEVFEKKLAKDGDTNTSPGKNESMLMDISLHEDQDVFHQDIEKRFHRIVSREPSQVVRYHRGGDPLWISAKRRLEKPPPCPRCDAERQFEFQILPALLNHLDLNLQGASPDWGSLFVYTCSKSCEIEIKSLTADSDSEEEEAEYVEEFVWKQDFADCLH